MTLIQDRAVKGPGKVDTCNAIRDNVIKGDTTTAAKGDAEPARRSLHTASRVIDPLISALLLHFGGVWARPLSSPPGPYVPSHSFSAKLGIEADSSPATPTSFPALPTRLPVKMSAGTRAIILPGFPICPADTTTSHR